MRNQAERPGFPRPGRRFRAGDRVVVRSPQEILATLDDDGSLDGLPFMPEMLRWCGQEFRVARRAEKTCVEGFDLQRRFPANDVVFLADLRCSGEQHDGCRRGCMMFWKEAWLRRAGRRRADVPVDARDVANLRARLKVKQDRDHYHCQSTQLHAATEEFPGDHRLAMALVALREVWDGNRTLPEVLRLAAHWRRLRRRWRKMGEQIRMLPGPNKRTPTAALGLQPGEKVRIKSEPEIVATLDANSRNRGLGFAVAMAVNCGREYEVKDRVDRIIVETTGEMREIQNTVSLCGLECLCYYRPGACPRGDLQYMREIWLERTPENAGRPGEARRAASSL